MAIWQVIVSSIYLIAFRCQGMLHMLHCLCHKYDNTPLYVNINSVFMSYECRKISKHLWFSESNSILVSDYHLFSVYDVISVILFTSLYFNFHKKKICLLTFIHWST